MGKAAPVEEIQFLIIGIFKPVCGRKMKELWKQFRAFEIPF